MLRQDTQSVYADFPVPRDERWSPRTSLAFILGITVGSWGMLGLMAVGLFTM